MTQMDELIARVEAATRPDRELDAAIWYACVEKPQPGDKRDNDMIGRWPSYTASIDAAMTLAPEGYALGFKRAPCQRSHAMLATIGYEVNASGATPALALCAASLRSRQEKQDG